ncbi:hypothetical protein RF11_10889 [Thelohanellus kitauei]|uniref:Uncharacterized protein n=1 Tax=Thelohanellus kitauei TaxID=669202 RepID=A0A0C2MBY1_THEKT|nr:hypothetical protein RF11_10889 [Thelohanellus kitauei]
MDGTVQKLSPPFQLILNEEFWRNTKNHSVNSKGRVIARRRHTRFYLTDKGTSEIGTSNVGGPEENVIPKQIKIKSIPVEKKVEAKAIQSQTVEEPEKSIMDNICIDYQFQVECIRTKGHNNFVTCFDVIFRSIVAHKSGYACEKEDQRHHSLLPILCGFD